jgi:hypothetical protein
MIISTPQLALRGFINRDGTGSSSDFITFRQYFGGFIEMFDFDGSVAASDFIQFRLRYGGSILRSWQCIVEFSRLRS